jgi:D-serine deaminase-like pyridoxal phosphate-dependent protein
MEVSALPTPSLLVDGPTFAHNVRTMADAWPGRRLRPHVKAFKSTALARELATAGHRGFCAATVRELEGLAAAGLGDDLLLANEVLDASRLGALVAAGHRVTVAVDSDETLTAARHGGVGEVLIDVNVGLPRCGCDPAEAGRLAERARRTGLEVRGVMGYEGHVVGLDDRAARAEGVEAAMAVLTAAHEQVGGTVVSGGGTGTWDLNRSVTELQAGSYVLMDTAYDRLGLPFRPALSVLGSVVSVNRSSGYAVADVGLKALGMDHGDPSVDGARVWFCSDEHLTYAPRDPADLPRVGDRVRVWPAHVDPTVAYHERMWVVDGSTVLDEWPVDLRNW